MASITEVNNLSTIDPEVINMFIHRIVKTYYTDKDGMGCIINPEKLKEFIENMDNDTPVSFTMDVKEIRIKFDKNQCLSQYPQLKTFGLIDEEDDKSLTEKDKFLIICLMGVLRDMFKLKPKDICLSYIRYVSNRGEYAPLGINIKYYDNTPEEIIGDFNI